MRRRIGWLFGVCLMLALAASLAAQSPGPPSGQQGTPSGPPPDGPAALGGQGPQGGGRLPHPHPPHMGPEGRWWVNPDVVQKIGLTADQQKQIDALFQKNRQRLIDASAAVQKEDAVLEPLLEADHPDEATVLAQIDRVAQARAELEKANARMLLGFRSVLTVEQWKKLHADRSHGSPDHPHPN